MSGLGDINSSFLPQQNLTPPPDSVSIEAVVKDDAKVEELPVDADGKVEEPKEDAKLCLSTLNIKLLKKRASIVKSYLPFNHLNDLS